MTYASFDNNEEGFNEWVKSHSFGLVINSSPGRLNPNYVIAHRPTCKSFLKHVGATTVYSKHCFDSANEAIAYLSGKGISKPSFGCTKCKVFALEPTSDSLQLAKSVEYLLSAGFSTPPPGNRAPVRKDAVSSPVERDPAIIGWILANARGKCELCAADAPFLTDKGRPYLEVHHVKTLATGGPDTVDNAVALCPNCHRAMHYSKFKVKLTEDLYKKVARLVRPA
jgi:HNH endonuclease